MANQVESVSVPQASDALAQGLKKLLMAVVANHKALGGNVMTEVSADVVEAVKDLGPLLSQMDAVVAEAKADPVAAVEAVEVAAYQGVEEAKAAAPAVEVAKVAEVAKAVEAK